jgi:hypothetical protein
MTTHDQGAAGFAAYMARRQLLLDAQRRLAGPALDQLNQHEQIAALADVLYQLVISELERSPEPPLMRRPPAGGTAAQVAMTPHTRQLLAAIDALERSNDLDAAALALPILRQLLERDGPL